MSSYTPTDPFEQARRDALKRSDSGKGISSDKLDEVLALLELEQKLARLDLEKIAEEKIAKLPEREALIRALENNREIPKRLKAMRKGPGRPKLHWKTKEKRRRETQRKYQATVYQPKVRERKARMLKEEGWYPVLVEQWKAGKIEYDLSREEWNEIVAPKVGDSLPNIRRYDPGKPVSIDNIWVVSTKGTVLFDGKEHKLKELGYML